MNQSALFVACERCARVGQHHGKADPKARLLRIAELDGGFCLECAVTEFLRITPPLCYMLGADERSKALSEEQESWDRCGGERQGPHVLLEPHIQEQFGQIVQVGMGQADPRAINWEWIVDNWDIPFPPLRRLKK